MTWTEQPNCKEINKDERNIVWVCSGVGWFKLVGERIYINNNEWGVVFSNIGSDGIT